MSPSTAALRAPLLLIGITILCAFAALAALAPVLAPYDAGALSGPRLQPPSASHPLGTDDIGQDVLSGLLWGGRSSLTLALGAGLLAMAIAVAVGVGAGLVGGWPDRVAMRAVDVFLTIPTLPLLIIVGATLARSRFAVVIIVGIVLWPGQARLLRAQTLSLRQRGFVSSAIGFGGGLLHVVRRHLVPALGPVIAAGFARAAGISIFLDAGLAFLGVGDPTAVTWGSMLSRALSNKALYLTPVWTWLVLPPGLAVCGAMLGLMLLGIGLEPAMNPRTRRT